MGKKYDEYYGKRKKYSQEFIQNNDISWQCYQVASMFLTVYDL